MMSEYIEQQPHLTGSSITPIPDYEIIQTEHYRAKYAGFLDATIGVCNRYFCSMSNKWDYY